MNKLTTDPCLEHTGHVSRICAREKDDTEQWKAIDLLRNDVKGLLLRIGIIVGGIGMLNTVITGVIVYFITKGIHP